MSSELPQKDWNLIIENKSSLFDIKFKEVW